VQEVLSLYTVRLDILTSIYLVFYIDLIRPTASDPLPTQIVDDSQPPPLVIDSELEY
jgi:hypothetical protein